MIIYILLTLSLDILGNVFFINHFIVSGLGLIPLMCPIKKSIIIAIVLGIICDLLFSNILFLNAISFILVILTSNQLIKKLNINSFAILIIISLVNIVYYLFLFITLLLVKSISFDLLLLIKVIPNVLLNIVYGYVSYLILNKLFVLKRQ